MSSVRLAVLAAVIALAVPASAAASVHLVSITPSVHRGGYVTLQVLTVFTVRCTIRVHHGTARPLTGPALAAKSNHDLGNVRWRWRMPAHAALGRWSVDLSCGTAGTLHTTFTVI
jgi:hypothetical protein